MDLMPYLPTVNAIAPSAPTGASRIRPPNTANSMCEKLNAALNEVLADPDSVRQIADHGVTVTAGSTDQLATLVTSELSRWTSVVKLATRPNA